MAKIFEHSEDADIMQLSIFETPATNMSVKDRRYLNYHPVSGITANTNVIHFSIKGNSMKYLDLLDSRLYVRCKLRDVDGNVPLTAKITDKDAEKPSLDDDDDDAMSKKDDAPKTLEVVFPVNHLLQSMWKQVEVYLGGKLVSSGSTNYHYKSMIKTLVYLLTSEGKKRALMSELFFEDSPGGHDVLTSEVTPNSGAYKRKAYTQNGATFEMEGNLNEDVMKLKKYLINGVDFDLKLYPARSAFLLMAKNVRKEYKIIIEDCLFKASTVDVGGSIISAHNQSLAKKAMAQYFFEQTQLNNFTVAKGQRNFSATAFQGRIPHRVVVAMVSAQRYNGDYHLNPFKFHHFDVTNMSLLVNDVSTPHRPLEMNFRKGQFASALFNLIKTRSNVVIDAESFDKGYSLFVFDVNPKLNRGQLPLQTSGNVRLEMQFEKELDESVQVLVYGEYESCIQIDHERTVYYTPI